MDIVIEAAKKRTLLLPDLFRDGAVSLCPNPHPTRLLRDLPARQTEEDKIASLDLAFWRPGPRHLT